MFSILAEGGGEAGHGTETNPLPKEKIVQKEERTASHERENGSGFVSRRIVRERSRF